MMSCCYWGWSGIIRYCFRKGVYYKSVNTGCGGYFSDLCVSNSKVKLVQGRVRNKFLETFDVWVI